ncbi:M15 family metallopeptidase, partial [Acinetobacter baumannii]
MDGIVAELDRLPDRLKAFLVPSAGTYNCRVVADTGVASMHAYGAAIDINVARSDYWAWANRRGDIAYRNRIPFEIV